MSEEGRNPSENFERFLVLSIIYDPAFRSYVLENVAPQFLNMFETKVIFETIYSMDKKKKPITFMGVYEQIKRNYNISEERLPVILDILEPYLQNPDTKMLNYFLDSIIPRMEDEIGQGLLIKAIAKSTALIEEKKYHEVFKLFSQVEQEGIYRKSEFINFWDLGDVAHKIKIDGIPTGIIGYDKNNEMTRVDDHIFYGGVGRGQLTFVTGRSGDGKTTLMWNVALYQSLRGYRVDYYTGEVNKEYLKLRGYSAMTGIPTFDLRKDLGTAATRLTFIKQRYSKQEELRIYPFVPGELTCGMISQNMLRDKKQGRMVDVVFVDYADILGSVNRYKDMRQEIMQKTTELNAIAKRYDCAVVTASQLNRKAWQTDEAQGDAVAEDISKLFKADLFFILTSKVETATRVGGSMVETETVNLKLDKSRYGSKGLVVTLDINRLTGKFFPIVEEGEESE